MTRIPTADISSIPRGLYCYDENGMCPFWSIDDSKPRQLNGYCSFLGEGDWGNKGLSLLWDQVKECGVNEGELSDYLEEH